MQTQESCRTGSRVYLNGVLTVVAALLALVVIQGSVGLPGASEANAAGRSVTEAKGINNPADQRQTMINELRRMNQRLDKLSAKFDKGAIEVEVVKMPNSERASRGD